jgi:hypothetical protein
LYVDSTTTPTRSFLNGANADKIVSRSFGNRFCNRSRANAVISG